MSSNTRGCIVYGYLHCISKVIHSLGVSAKSVLRVESPVWDSHEVHSLEGTHNAVRSIESQAGQDQLERASHEHLPASGVKSAPDRLPTVSSSIAKTLVIIPTYNERENVGSALTLIMQQPGLLDVLVVDDGSPDGTPAVVREVAKQFSGRVMMLERDGKQGLGTAYLEGFKYALEHGYDMICGMDADLSHNPDDLPRLLKPVLEGSADMAIGSRYIGGVRIVNWPLSRLMLSYCAGIYTRVITRLPVRDVTAGFLCYRRSVLEALDFSRIKSNGYGFLIEMKFRIWRKGYRLLEVPIIFTERTEGQSKMSKAIIREAAIKVWEFRFRDLFRRL